MPVIRTESPRASNYVREADIVVLIRVAECIGDNALIDDAQEIVTQMNWDELWVVET